MCWCAQSLADTQLAVVVEVRDVAGMAEDVGTQLGKAFEEYMQPRPAHVDLRQAVASQFPALPGSGR